MLRLEEGLFSKLPIHSIRINDIPFQKIVFFRVTACETQICYMYYTHSEVMSDRPYSWTGNWNTLSHEKCKHFGLENRVYVRNVILDKRL